MVAQLVPTMTAGEARACVDQINSHFQQARYALHRLYEAEGWRALGYDSWRACAIAEFSQSQAYLYRLLQAAQIEARISPIGERAPIPESHLRPLAALPEGRQAEVYREAVASAPGGKLTGAHVATVAGRYTAAVDAAVVGLLGEVAGDDEPDQKSAHSNTPRDERDFWRTPPAIFAKLDAEHGPFLLDAAANTNNHLCPLWLGPGGLAEDALAVSWRQGDRPVRAWCNPPYSRNMVERFVRKAHEEARLGHAHTTILLFTWTDRPWWHELVWDDDTHTFRPGVIVNFFKGRIRFFRPNGECGGSPWEASLAITFRGVADS